jgi:SAM-dependent methyltransferase
MIEYWESRFKSEGAMWKSEPADSAIKALDLFKSANINDILIPGFGYGRNAAIFLENGFNVTGIEISGSAIELARSRGIRCVIHHGSVTSMPYDSKIYEGIFCYALIHLLSSWERRNFLACCYNQLNTNGIMVFVAASEENSLFGSGKYLANNRYEIARGLKVYFYGTASVLKEFSPFGLKESVDIDEPVKFMEGEEAMKFKYIVCKKN